ncbi:hypothetical protein PHISP_01898 [Aspergillus sp. HF37]|nr:hypothetical protein PHISP_01898 [Aspergillus sp. HF37]
MLTRLALAPALFSAVAHSLPRGNHPHQDTTPPPPEPEPIVVTRLPLPPVAPTSDVGACSLGVNPRGTGCIAKTSGLQSGNFLPDDKHVVAMTNFTGAPAAPDPGSVYDSQHLILIKTDGSSFRSGDAWKCITCGVPDANTQGRAPGLAYPQSFRDGRRVLAGSNIVECDEDLASEACTPEKTRIVPLRWNRKPDGSGDGGDVRELRLHPDNVHVGFNSFTVDSGGKFGQYAYFARMVFNPDPDIGEPMTPRYDLVNVTMLYDKATYAPVGVDSRDPSKLVVRQGGPVVGELRGFSGTGAEVTYLGYPTESSNIDVYAANLITGQVRRLTAHPEYVDPVDVSPDDKWHVVMDTRFTDRQMFLAGLRRIPPLTDLVTVGAVSSTRNNGRRRFFNVFLIDRYGDRAPYFGQKVNAEGSGIPGSGDINDPEWNGRADPKWSWDGTRIVYTEAKTMPPACGGDNPLPCYPSTEDGGRTERIMIANLTSRQPVDPPAVQPVPDTVPWGTPFPPGADIPDREFPSAGSYTLDGEASGWADVSLVADAGNTALETVSVVYHDFSDDGLNILAGSERVTVVNPVPTLQQVDWHSNLTQTGPDSGTKMTSPGGFQMRIDIMTNIFEANGVLTTTVDGKEYTQPANGESSSGSDLVLGLVKQFAY